MAIKKVAETLVPKSPDELTRERLLSWFPDLSDAAMHKISNYASMLRKFNPTLNLVSVLSMEKLEATHLADCILACRIVKRSLIPSKALYDIGTGNGLPGIVFSILYPELSVICVDRDQRKLEFLKTVASECQLSNVSFVLSDVEKIEEGTVHNAVARGFAPLGKAMLSLRKPAAKGCLFYHLKSESFSNELSKVPTQLFSFWKPSLAGQYRLPELKSELCVVLTEKIGD